MFKIDTTKVPATTKKPIPIKANKNIIRLERNERAIPDITPKNVTSKLLQVVSSVETAEEECNDILFEVY